MNNSVILCQKFISGIPQKEYLKKVFYTVKKALLPTICILLCTLCIVFVPTDAEAAIYEDTIRLHILAPSDSVEDQTLKLEIRDRVLEKYGSLFEEGGGFEAAEKALREKVSQIEADCILWVKELGYSYTVKAELEKEWYGTREYSSFSLPAGEYLSLKISLGGGEGQNWWCVMYPPMCLEASLGKEVDYSPEEQKLISNDRYRVKFKLLEASSELFKKRK